MVNTDTKSQKIENILITIEESTEMDSSLNQENSENVYDHLEISYSPCNVKEEPPSPENLDNKEKSLNSYDVYQEIEPCNEVKIELINENGNCSSPEEILPTPSKEAKYIKKESLDISKNKIHMSNEKDNMSNDKIDISNDESNRKTEIVVEITPAAMTSEKERKPKLKRKFISLQQKIDILDQINNGKKLTAIAKDLELNASTIRTILQNESKIRSAVMSRSLQTLSKSSRIKDSLIPKTEKCLMIWIEDCFQNNIPINSCLIKAKAQKIFKHLKELETVSSDKPKLKFVSSNGWFERFRNRFSLQNIQIHGERASADYESARKFKEEFPKIIDEGGYTADQVYNADETRLYWKKMLKRTYLSKNERSDSGFKASKESITLLVCSNASGDHITKPMLISRFLSPRTMKGIDKILPVYCRANEKAWVTAAIFHDWFYNCFVPEVEDYSQTKNISFKALLLIDNAPGHPIDLVHPNVKVLFLPPNTTSILQPLDQGIIKTLKSYYIRRTLELVLGKIKCNPDMKLPDTLKDYTILKCVELISLSVQELKSSTLNACWENIWPEIVSQENSSDSTSINIEPILNIARSVGEEFADMNEKDIYELINDAEDLDEEELVQLADTSDASIINSVEEGIVQSTDKIEENVCIENLNKIVKLGKQLEILVTNCDSCAERTTEFKMNLQHSLAPYVKMLKQHKIPNEESSYSEILISTDEQGDVLLSKENNTNSNGDTFEHYIKRKCRWKNISDSSDSE